MVQPGRSPGLTQHPRDQVGALLWRLRRQQDFLDRHFTVKELVAGAPYPAHATLADRLGQQVPAGYQSSRPTRHSKIIGVRDVAEIRHLADTDHKGTAAPQGAAWGAAVGLC